MRPCGGHRSYAAAAAGDDLAPGHVVVSASVIIGFAINQDQVCKDLTTGIVLIGRRLPADELQAERDSPGAPRPAALSKRYADATATVQYTGPADRSVSIAPCGLSARSC